MLLLVLLLLLLLVLLDDKTSNGALIERWRSGQVGKPRSDRSGPWLTAQPSARVVGVDAVVGAVVKRLGEPDGVVVVLLRLAVVPQPSTDQRPGSIERRV